MFGILDAQKIEQVLHAEVVGRIGCHADGVTYVIPIGYAYDGEYIYCRTQEGMKINMMRKNKNICFEVDTMNTMANWQSVIAWGEYEELTDPKMRHDALTKLHNRILPLVPSATAQLSAEWPFAPTDINSITGVIFRIRLQNKSGRFENNDVPSFLFWG
ncbi:MAG: pyridoxamine 5'-phosphate oxidase family protein [Bacteroidetes bacterium]|nr:pyridoxamine 5'-phosphate oxidase family protein [Bacteroidota bacterium]